MIQSKARDSQIVSLHTKYKRKGGKKELGDIAKGINEARKPGIRDDMFPEVPDTLNDTLLQGNTYATNRIIAELEGPDAGWYDYSQNIYARGSDNEWEWWGPHIYSKDKVEQERIIFDQDVIERSENMKSSKAFKAWLKKEGFNVKQVYLGET